MRDRQFLLKAGAAAALAGVIAFLALRTSPYLQYVSWMPRRLGVWADSNGIVRNTVAFFGLSLVVLLLFRPRLALIAALGGFGAALEIAQRWIPGRVYDPKDIVASAAGVLLAWPLAWWWHRRRCAARRC